MKRTWMVCATLLWLMGCGDGDAGEPGDVVRTDPGPWMRPGDNCLRCHDDDGEAARRPWTAAGTVFPDPEARATDGIEGVTLRFTDLDGEVLETLITNAEGNFYTDAPLPERYLVELEYEGERIRMPCPPPAGSCNACHSPNPVGFAPGRIYLPSAHVDQGPFDCDDWEQGGSGRP